MFAWIFFFMLIALILGIQIPEEDYPFVEYRVRTFLYFWMTSMGEIDSPKYEELLDEEEEGQSIYDIILIGCIWLVWLFN